MPGGHDIAVVQQIGVGLERIDDALEASNPGQGGFEFVGPPPDGVHRLSRCGFTPDQA
jgi:hypothetical protein